MALGPVGQAVAMFAATNVDDLVLLALYIGRAGTDRAAAGTVVLGQYLGFGAILLASVAGAFGLGLLPEAAVPYLGLQPIALGVRVALRHRRARDEAPDAAPPAAGADDPDRRPALRSGRARPV